MFTRTLIAECKFYFPVPDLRQERLDEDISFMSHSPENQELHGHTLKTDLRDRAPGRHHTFFLLAFFVLLLEFLLNPIGVADREWLETHQLDSEAIVIARMIPVADGGFFAVGGFLRMIDGDFYGNVPNAFQMYLESAPGLPSARFTLTLAK